MFKCAYCKSDIETDSVFCDQCGKEIFLCQTCKQPREGEWCEEDGGKLVSVKNGTAIHQDDSKTGSATPIPKQKLQSGQGAPDKSPGKTISGYGLAQPDPATLPKLRLINKTLNMTLDIQNGEIMGRTTGPYADKLNRFTAISGKHLVFQFNGYKWYFKDLGSTNGTKYNRTNNAWSETSKVSPGTSVEIEDSSFILIANIELAVQIENNLTTQRI